MSTPEEMKKMMRDKAKDEADIAREEDIQRLRNLLKSGREQERKFTTEEEGKRVDMAFAELDQAAERMIQEGQKGYDNWQAAMMSIVALSELMVKALAGQVLGVITNALYENTPGIKKLWEGNLYDDNSKPLGSSDSYWRGGVVGVTDRIRANLGAKSTPSTFPLPNVMHDIQVADGNFTIDKDKLFFSNGAKFTAPQLDTIAKVIGVQVDAWLQSNSYVKDSDGKYKNAGSVLTPETFNQLRDDPSTSLDAFLSQEMDMKVESGPRPS